MNYKGVERYAYESYCDENNDECHRRRGYSHRLCDAYDYFRALVPELGGEAVFVHAFCVRNLLTRAIYAFG